MSKTLTTIYDIPATILAFAEAWGTSFMDSNKDWKDKDFQEDSWHYFEGFDLNLVCENGRLTICAYSSDQEDDGYITTNYDDFMVIFKKGKR